MYRSYKGQGKAPMSAIPYFLNGSAHAMQVIKGGKKKKERDTGFSKTLPHLDDNASHMEGC